MITPARTPHGDYIGGVHPDRAGGPVFEQALRTWGSRRRRQLAAGRRVLSASLPPTGDSTRFDRQAAPRHILKGRKVRPGVCAALIVPGFAQRQAEAEAAGYDDIVKAAAWRIGASHGCVDVLGLNGDPSPPASIRSAQHRNRGPPGAGREGATLLVSPSRARAP